MLVEQRCHTWPQCAVQKDVDTLILKDKLIELMKQKRSLSPIFLIRLGIEVSQRNSALDNIDRYACADCPNRTMEAE